MNYLDKFHTLFHTSVITLADHGSAIEAHNHGFLRRQVSEDIFLRTLRSIGSL